MHGRTRGEVRYSSAQTTIARGKTQDQVADVLTPRSQRSKAGQRTRRLNKIVAIPETLQMPWHLLFGARRRHDRDAERRQAEYALDRSELQLRLEQEEIDQREIEVE